MLSTFHCSKWAESQEKQWQEACGAKQKADLEDQKKCIYFPVVSPQRAVIMVKVPWQFIISQMSKTKKEGNLYNRFLQKNTQLRLIFPLLVLLSYLHVKDRLVYKPTCVPDIQTQLPWNQWQSSCLQWRLLGFAHIYRIRLSWKLKGITAFQKLEWRKKEMRRQICCERDPRWNNWSKFSCLDVVSFSIITLASSCFHWGEVTWDSSSSNGNFNTQMTRTVKVALHICVSTGRIKI